MPEQQQQTQALLASLFEQANQLTPEHKEAIVQFLSGNRSMFLLLRKIAKIVTANPTPNEGAVKQIQLNVEQKVNSENNTPYIEMIIFEINYTSGMYPQRGFPHHLLILLALGSWRKFRRKRNIAARPQ